MINEGGDILVCMELSKIIQYPDKWNRSYVMGYLPKGGDKFLYKSIELSSPWSYYNLHFTHNNFAHSLNILFSGTNMGVLQNGLSRDLAAITEQALLVINDDFSEALFTPIRNKKVNELIKTQIDTGFFLNARVAGMHTNKYGLSTVTYTGASEPIAALGNTQVKTYRLNISFTQFDDKGTEVWATAIPMAKLRNYDNGYPNAFHKTSAAEVFYSVNANTKNNNYVLYNDVDEFFEKTLSTSNDSIYNASYANAIYCKINRKREVSKYYLLGKSVEGESKQLYTGSGDFKEETADYAAVFLHKQGKKAETKIAWVHFEP